MLFLGFLFHWRFIFVYLILLLIKIELELLVQVFIVGLLYFGFLNLIWDAFFLRTLTIVF